MATRRISILADFRQRRSAIPPVRAGSGSNFLSFADPIGRSHFRQADGIAVPGVAHSNKQVGSIAGLIHNSAFTLPGQKPPQRQSILSPGPFLLTATLTPAKFVCQVRVPSGPGAHHAVVLPGPQQTSSKPTDNRHLQHELLEKNGKKKRPGKP